MRSCLTMRVSSFISKIAFAVLLLLIDCSPKKGEEGPAVFRLASDIRYEVSEDKSTLEGYYELEHMKEWYTERMLPPEFNYDQDVSKKALADLWLLRNEIYARNGFLFDDAVLRGYFNEFKWYQPVFDVPDFKLRLNTQEHNFVEQVLARESELAGERYLQQGDYQLINFSHVFNAMQFKSIPDELKRSLVVNNFAIVPAKTEQFFYLYDNNHYEYIPNFITTDFYLQVLHKHFSSLLQKIEEEKFIPQIAELLTFLHQQANDFQLSETDPVLKPAAERATTFLAIAATLLTEKEYQVPEGWQAFFDEELDRILNAEGVGSGFLDDPLLNYSQFTPRGNYTKTPELERYFRCAKWLNSAKIFIDDDEKFLSAALISIFINRSEKHAKLFADFNKALQVIVGDEDHLSMSAVVYVTRPEEIATPSRLKDKETVNAVRADLMRRKTGRILPKGGDNDSQTQLERPSVLFTAGRYTFDAEILSRLIHVLRPKPLRPFPKGLDVFAALGNAEAENILINEYNEQAAWPAYGDSLKKLKAQFADGIDVNRIFYSKIFNTINSVHEADDRYPHFMRTQSWKRKNLVTSLAAWTELKHDMLLYTVQPSAAQAGEGGGPPPPQHLSYVEPNTSFWQNALDLIGHQEAVLREMNLLTADIEYINKDLREIAELLLKVSQKELSNDPISKEEFDELSWIGGKVEYLTFRIFGTDHLPEKERFVALVADVYNYNGVYLEEAVGMVDDIYVIAEINGKPYLTKGAVFSYHEFTSNTPLTDDAWRESLLKGKEYARPQWTKPFTVRTQSLESKPAYSF
jgi:hypothetical protein